MHHLGANVYHWGHDEQGRLAAERVAPLVVRLLAEGSVERFWFTSFDARGPHLMLLFTCREGAEPALRRRLETELAAMLAAAPSEVVLDPEVLAERHRQCRGKELCSADELPGVAANNSFVLFTHPADGYPFAVGGGVDDADALWRRVGELALWAVAQRGAGASLAAAVRWTAAVDAALAAAGQPAGDYWRHHATTLVMPLADRLASDEAAVLAALPGLVGERNEEAFGQLWRQVEAGWDGPDARPLVAAACSPAAPAATPGGDRWSLLREITHTTLGQLGLPVRLHLPLVFYAWQRNLSLTPAA